MQRFLARPRPFVTAMLFISGLAWAGTAEAQPQLQAQATAEVNVRSGPGTQYPVQFTLAAGTVVNILACSEGYEWCQVALGNQVGWASGQFLQPLQANQPITEAGPALGPVFEFLLGLFGPQLGLPQLPQEPPAPPPRRRRDRAKSASISTPTLPAMRSV